MSEPTEDYGALYEALDELVAISREMKSCKRAWFMSETTQKRIMAWLYDPETSGTIYGWDDDKGCRVPFVTKAKGAFPLDCAMSV